jgi:hypothetical protein
MFELRKIMVLIVIGLSAMGYTACQKESDSKIDRFSEEEITELLIDLSLARAAVAPLNIEVADSLRLVYYRQIAEIHGIQLREIDQLLEELSAEPDLLKEYFNRAGDSIRLRSERGK